MMITAYPIDEQAHKMLPKRGSTGPRYHGNTYPIDASIYARTQSGAIMLRASKPKSRRDNIRAGKEPKNRFRMKPAEMNRACQA